MYETFLDFEFERYKDAEILVREIHTITCRLSDQTYKSVMDAAEVDIKRLKELNLSIIRAAEQKSIKEVFLKTLFKFSLLQHFNKI